MEMMLKKRGGGDKCLNINTLKHSTNDLYLYFLLFLCDHARQYPSADWIPALSPLRHTDHQQLATHFLDL
jgi:hypothetical protein